jgi:hypothetical protein
MPRPGACLDGVGDAFQQKTCGEGTLQFVEQLQQFSKSTCHSSNFAKTKKLAFGKPT